MHALTVGLAHWIRGLLQKGSVVGLLLMCQWALKALLMPELPKLHAVAGVKVYFACGLREAVVLFQGSPASAVVAVGAVRCSERLSVGRAHVMVPLIQ